MEGLVACLNSLLSPDPQARRGGENALAQGSQQPGLGVALLEVSQNPSLPTGLRQLAAVILKKHLKEHWTFESGAFREPPIGEEEKAALRARLPRGLADPERKLRTAAGMAVAAVARWDCPQDWPELMPGLLSVVAQKPSPEHVDGTIRCIAMFVDELGEDQILEMAPGLLHEMAPLLSPGSGADAALVRRVLSILRSVVGAMQSVTGTHAAGVKALLTEVLAEWAPLLAAVLAPREVGCPPGSGPDLEGLEEWGTGGGIRLQVPELWAAQREALGILTVLVSSFGRLSAPVLTPVLGAVWHRFSAGLPQYVAAVVEGEADAGFGDPAPADGAEAEDGERAVGLEGLLAQTMELILCVVGNARFRGLIAPHLPQLLGLAVGYAQMTAEQEERWTDCPNQYVADEEDDMSSLRASCEMLVDEVFLAFEEAAAPALSRAVGEALARSGTARASGRPGWWREREAALLLVGSAADTLLGLGPRAFDLAGLLSGPVVEDLAPGSPPFLRGRALWLAGRLAAAAPRAARPGLLRAAAAGLEDPGAPVRAGACRALAQLCARVAPGEAADAAEAGFRGLAALLAAASAQSGDEDSTHLALGAAAALARAAPAAAAAWEPALAPALLAAWERGVGDPLLAPDALEALAALAAVPAALPALQRRALPTLGALLRDPGAHPPLVLDGALDLVALLLRPSGEAAAREVHAALSPPVLALALRHDDAEVLASACQYFRALLQVGGGAALSWQAEGLEGSLAPHLAQALVRLLDPELEERAAAGVGPLMLELLRCAEAELAPHLPRLLAALGGRLVRAETSLLVQGLVTVLATLVHTRPDSLLACLAGTTLGSGQPALHACLQKWVGRQIEMRTPYDIRLTTTALGALLLRPGADLDAVAVRGRRLDVEGGILTRARAAQRAERWSSVPLRAKIVQLLVDAHIEATAQDLHRGGATDDDDDDEEWEEGSGSGSDDAGGRPYNGLEDLLDLEGADDFGEGQLDAVEAERRRKDPLSQLDLPAHIRGVLGQYAAASPDGLRAAAAEMSPMQQQTLQQILM
ncbi:hypothetical protein ACKKBG_A12895 [Auxenochlorella protothecoides x Auxenochlorella symbiontica]